MTIDNVLEILEKHKLRIPSNVFYELKADIVNFEEPTTKNDLGVDKEERELALMYLEQIKEDYIEGVGYERHPLPEYYAIETAIKSLVLPSVTPQEPRCKNCKWWKDSDGEYRRGCGAESQCPINRREVFEGNGYCFLFEPQGGEE